METPPRPTDAQNDLASYASNIGHALPTPDHPPYDRLPYKCECGAVSPREPEAGDDTELAHQLAFAWYLRHVVRTVADGLLSGGFLTVEGRDAFVDLLENTTSVPLALVFDTVYGNPELAGPKAPQDRDGKSWDG